jgi:hypothetical protein
MIPMLWNKPEWCQDPTMNTKLKNTQTQCTNIKQSGVIDQTNKYIYDDAFQVVKFRTFLFFESSFMAITVKYKSVYEISTICIKNINIKTFLR